MRVVAGKWRGRALEAPADRAVRPTSDRARESLFDLLTQGRVARGQNPLLDARVLDVFAGTGALGIEALSRGAGTCTFVERDRELCRGLSDTLARLHVGDDAQVVHADGLAWLDSPGPPCGLVFLDPPFGADAWGAAAHAIERTHRLVDGGFAYVEAPLDATPRLPANWLPHREGRAGAVRFALYRRSAADPLQ